MWVNSHYKYAKSTKAYTQESFLVSLSQSYPCLHNFSVLYILKSIHSTICKHIVFICFYLNIYTHTHTHTRMYMGFPGGASSREPACQCMRRKRCRFNPSPEDNLEKGMVTHSSILAWKILWTDEPGGLPSKESQRVGLD